MKKILIITVIVLVGLGLISLVFIPTKAVPSMEQDGLRNGDIIFQSSEYGQSKAIQLATHSKYSHCGIIYVQDGKLLVYEAVGPVKTTPLDEWITHGTGSHYVVRRLKKADEVLTLATTVKMMDVGTKYIGKDYDIYFGWSDEKIYCSELVWKIYKEATGLELGKLRQLKDFDLSAPIVKKIMQERYGNNVPLNEQVISPGDLFNSELLETVVSK
jgi:hypothetical protein